MCIVTLSSSRSTVCLFEFVRWFTPLLLWKLDATTPRLQLCASPCELSVFILEQIQRSTGSFKCAQVWCRSEHLGPWLPSRPLISPEPSSHSWAWNSTPWATKSASRCERMCTGIMRQQQTHRTWHSRRSYSGLPGMLLPLSCCRSLAITCMHYWDLPVAPSIKLVFGHDSSPRDYCSLTHPFGALPAIAMISM